MKLFWNSYDETNILKLFTEKSKHVSIFGPYGTSRSRAAILEMPQYVAYQKNVAYALLTCSTKSHNFKKYCTIIPLLVLKAALVSVLCPSSTAYIVQCDLNPPFLFLAHRF